jgi:hypothetical protein
MNVEEDSKPPATQSPDKITNKTGIGETLEEEEISRPMYKDGTLDILYWRNDSRHQQQPVRVQYPVHQYSHYGSRRY